MNPNFGPIELVVINFPGNKFKGEIIPELKNLVEKGIIRIIDIIFATKNKDGDVAVVELEEIGDEHVAFQAMVAGVDGMLNDKDVSKLAETMENNSSAGFMLFENTWATDFVKSVKNAHGQVVINERIPRTVIEEVAKKKKGVL